MDFVCTLAFGVAIMAWAIWIMVEHIRETRRYTDDLMRRLKDENHAKTKTKE